MNQNINIITKNALANDLRMIGLNAGDSVYVHTSLKSIGYIDKGADTLIEAFLEVLGEEGTLVVPTHTLSFEGRNVPPYEPDITKSVLGAFPEAVRKHPLAKRSLHPSHSSAAIGKNAVFFTQNHDLKNALGYNSPLHRLYRMHGKVLLLGVNHTANTSLHLAESLACMEYTKLHYDTSWGSTVYMKNADNSISRVKQIEFPGCSHEFQLMDGFFKYAGIACYGKIGNARSELLEATQMVDITIKVLKHSPTFFLCHEENCPCCPERIKLMQEKAFFPYSDSALN